MSRHFLTVLLTITCSSLVQAEDLRISDVLLTLVEQAELAAGQAGALTQIPFREGEIVDEGTLLGQIDDAEAQLLVVQAETELAVASELAQSDISARLARKSQEVAQAELLRAQESNAKFTKSVSASELDRLQLVVDKLSLEVEMVEQEHRQAKLAVDLKQNAVARAKLHLERRRLKAPFLGMIVAWHLHRGEWVEPGTKMVRLVRMDILRAEAFVSAEVALALPAKAPIRLQLRATSGASPIEVAGQITFISPEIDPINGQCRIWAEIPNPDRTLRPGQMCTMLINATATTDPESR